MRRESRALPQKLVVAGDGTAAGRARERRFGRTPDGRDGTSPPIEPRV